MSVTIDTELKNFKDKVGNSLDSMNNVVTSLGEKLDTAVASNNSAKDSFSANYNSENKSTVLSKFDSISLNNSRANATVLFKAIVS